MLESQHSFKKGGKKKEWISAPQGPRKKLEKKDLCRLSNHRPNEKRLFFFPPWHQAVLQTIILFLSLSLTVFEFWVLANLSSSCSFLKAGRISRVISNRNSFFVFACAAFPSASAAHSCQWSAQHWEPFAAAPRTTHSPVSPSEKWRDKSLCSPGLWFPWGQEQQLLLSLTP